MEGKKPTASSSSIVSQLFGDKESASSADSSSAGIFNTVFPPPSSVVGRGSAQSELLGSFRDQQPEGQVWNAQNTTADGISQDSPSKGQSTPYKDRNSIYQDGRIEPCFLGSSLFYGGQDVCAVPSTAQTSGTQGTFKKDGDDDLTNPNIASRGNWWQGSLYY